MIISSNLHIKKINNKKQLSVNVLVCERHLSWLQTSSSW